MPESETNRRYIVNLEFPPWCDKLEIGGLCFKRVTDYRDQLAKLQHMVDTTAEFSVHVQAGQHAVTASVDLPTPPPPNVLPWAGGATALDDILLLLSMFTGRDVFLVPTNPPDERLLLERDPREMRNGFILRLSLPSLERETKREEFFVHVQKYDARLERLEQVYERVKEPEWQKKYRKGYFLFLVANLLRARYVDESFINSWIIWEHLFACHNEAWLSPKDILGVLATQKISFLLVKYALRDSITATDHGRLEELAAIRNRLVHAGHFPEREKVHDDANLFIHMTEFIVTKTLDLKPEDMFDTMKSFEEFLSRKAKPKKVGGKNPK